MKLQEYCNVLQVYAAKYKNGKWYSFSKEPHRTDSAYEAGDSTANVAKIISPLVVFPDVDWRESTIRPQAVKGNHIAFGVESSWGVAPGRAILAGDLHIGIRGGAIHPVLISKDMRDAKAFYRAMTSLDAAFHHVYTPIEEVRITSREAWDRLILGEERLFPGSFAQSLEGKAKEKKEMKFKKDDLVMANGRLAVIVETDTSLVPYNTRCLDNGEENWGDEDNVRAPTLTERTAFDPDSPLAKFLVGKKVHASDDFYDLETYLDDPAVLTSIEKTDSYGDDSSYPFRLEDVSRFKFVAALAPSEKPDVLELTMADLEQKYGCKVKIKK